MRPLTDFIKIRILELAKERKTSREIGYELQISHMSVIRTLKSSDDPDILSNLSNKGGKPRKISDRTARHIGRSLVANKIRSPKDGLTMLEQPASVWTLRRALNRIGMKAKEKLKKPLLSKKSIKARKSFLDRYKDWTVDDWKHVCCSQYIKYLVFILF